VVVGLLVVLDEWLVVAFLDDNFGLSLILFFHNFDFLVMTGSTLDSFNKLLSHFNGFHTLL